MLGRMKRKIEALKSLVENSEEVAALQHENELLQTELDQSFETNASLIKQLTDMKKQIDKLTENNSELQDEIKRLKLKLKPKDAIEKKFCELDFFD